MSGNKLTELWLNKRKKAIQIIKNDCEWPDKSKVTFCQKKTEAFFRDEKLFVLAYSSNPYWLLKHVEIIQFHGSQPIK